MIYLKNNTIEQNIYIPRNTVDSTVKKISILAQNKKTVNIVENKTERVLPDEGYDAIKEVEVNVSVPDPTLSGTGWETEPLMTIRPDRFSKLKEDLEYTRKKRAEWNPENTSTGETFEKDLNLIYFPKIDMSNVKNMDYMFYGCKNLTDVPSLNTDNVESMGFSFYDCRSLTEVPKLNYSNVKYFKGIFDNCRSLTYIPTIDTSKAETMEYAFVICEKLKTIDQLDFGNVKSTYGIMNFSPEVENLGGFKGLKASLDIRPNEKLTRQSLLNVIDCLGPATPGYSDGKPQLKMRPFQMEKLTEAEIKVATDKGWTVLN